MAVSSTVALSASTLTVTALADTSAKTKITKVSSDPYDNTSAYHATALEADHYPNQLFANPGHGNP